MVDTCLHVIDILGVAMVRVKLVIIVLRRYLTWKFIDWDIYGETYIYQFYLRTMF